MAHILVLGGTQFLGRHFAQHALEAGHQVTLLHRGVSNPGLFPAAQHLLADRNGEGFQSALHGQTWDTAIDTSAYLPRQVQSAAAALAARVGQYQLVSSISAYDSFEPQGTAETAALQVLDDPATETVDGSTYGGLKALCEAQALAGFGTRCLISRPGLLVGPHDTTSRFSWWVQRMLKGGDVLAPGDPAAPVQFIDARDAAAWMLLHAERGSSGVFNLNGPPEGLTMGGLLHTAQQTLNPDARLHWVDEDFLLAEGVKPWTELPVWLPAAQNAMHRIDCSRARAAGLRCRPLAETLADLAAWLQRSGAHQAPAAAAVGLSPAREAELLQAWWQQRPASTPAAG